MDTDKYPGGEYTAPRLCRGEKSAKSPFFFPREGINPSGPILWWEDPAANPVTLPGVEESTSGQAEVKGPKRGRKGHFCARPICWRAPQRCSTAQAPGLGYFFPQTVAIIIIKQLTPITPSSPRSQGMDTAQGKFAAVSPLHILI